MAGTILAVPAIGLTAIFAVLRFANFALASHATIGAFAGYVANTVGGWPATAAVVAAFVVAGLAGVVNDELVLKPLRPAGALTTAIAAIALENVVRFIFGNELRGYDLPIRRDWRFEGIRIGPQQVENLVIAIAVMAASIGLSATARMALPVRVNERKANSRPMAIAAMTRFCTCWGPTCRPPHTQSRRIGRS